MKSTPPSNAEDAMGSVRARVALADARDATRGFLTDPLGTMVATYSSLGRTRAMTVGLVFAAVFALNFALTVYRQQQSLFGLMMGLNGGGAVLTLKMVFAGTVVPASLFGVGTLVGKALRTFDGIEPHIYVAGVALLPFSIFLLAISLFGTEGYLLLSALFTFALSYTILLCFCGYTRLVGMKDSAAALMVPFMLASTAWITKTVISAMFGIP